MRWVVGLLLISAAVLKAFQLVADPSAALLTPFGDWLLPIQIGLELGIGLLVLSGLYWDRLRWFALILFAAFAVYSLNLAIGGTTSCGCFGPVEVNPWWTLLVDASIVLGLLFAVRHSHTAPFWHVPVWLHRHTVAIIIVVTVVSITLLIRHAGSRIATASSLLTRAGDIVVLEPETWIGKPLPIVDAVDLDLSQGRWIVLLHRHDCSDCREAIPRYEELAFDQAVALIEVPPFGESEKVSHGWAIRGQLSNNHEWFVPTPVEIQLQDGVVVAVNNGHDH